MRAERTASLLIVAAFGPYLIGGIRTEQLAVYMAGAVAMLSVIVGRRTHLPALRLAVLWAALAIVSITSGLVAPFGAGPSLIGGTDALLAPVAVMLVLAVACAAPAQRASVVRSVQITTVVMLALNGLLALAMTRLELAPFLAEHFWSSGDGLSIGERVLKRGRYGGVFNSPLSAGIGSGIGVVLLAFLVSTRQVRGAFAIFLSFGILVGAALHQSKVTLVTLPLALGVVIATSNRQRVTGLMKVAILGAASAWALVATGWWAEYGRDRFSALFFGQNGGSLGAFSGGRLGENTRLGELVDQVQTNALWFGYGPAGTGLPLDNTFVEVFARAGVVGLLLFMGWLLVLVGSWIRSRSLIEKPQWIACGALLVVLMVGAAGGPSVTQNRAGTLLLMNIVPLLASVPPRRLRGAPRADARDPARVEGAGGRLQDPVTLPLL